MRIGVRLGPLYVSTSTRRRRKPKVGGQVRKAQENRAADRAAAARAKAQAAAARAEAKAAAARAEAKAAADRAADQAAAFGVLEYNRGEPALALGAAQTVPVDPAKDAPADRARRPGQLS